MSRHAATRGLEIISAGLLGVTLAAAYAGPLRFEIFGATLSVRTLSRPLLAAVLLVAIRFFLAHDRTSRAAADVIARVMLGALIVAGVTGWLRFLSTTCGGADSYAYVSAAERLLAGDLVHEEPLASLLPFSEGIGAASPLGYVPAGRHPNASVPAYPLGLPALMAAARAFAGPAGPFIIAPIAGLVLLAAAYVTAVSWYRDRNIGLLACALLALNPLVFTYSIQPMSDVPAAAALLVALALISRGWPFLAGIAGGMALLIRPALAPAAITLAVLSLAGPSSRPWHHGLRYLMPVSAAFLLQGWTQWYLYGHPLASGYGSIADLFTVRTVATNARIYGYWGFFSLGPVWLGAVVIGLAVRGESSDGIRPAMHPRATPTRKQRASGTPGGRRCSFLKYRPDILGRRALPTGRLARLGARRYFHHGLLAVSDRIPRLAVAATGFAIGLPYLLYRPYDHWETLRFLLPAIAVATIVGAAGLMAVTRRVMGASLGALLAGVIAFAMGFGWMSWLAANGVFQMPEDEMRHQLAGELVAQATTPQAVILALQHSGSLRYYSRRQTINWDRIPAGAMDSTVRALQRHGFDVYVMIDSDAERVMFESRHGNIIEDAGWLPNGQRRNVQLFQAPRRSGGAEGHPPSAGNTPGHGIRPAVDHSLSVFLSAETG